MHTRCVLTYLPTHPARNLWRGSLLPLGCAAAPKQSLGSIFKIALTSGPRRDPAGARALATEALQWLDQKRTPVVTIAALNPSNTSSAATGP